MCIIFTWNMSGTDCLLGGICLSEALFGFLSKLRGWQTYHIFTCENYKANANNALHHQAREESSSTVKWDARCRWRREGKPNRG